MPMAANPREAEPAPHAPAHLLGGKMEAGQTALVVLATIAVVGAVYYARLPMIVVMISILLAFVLAPVVDLLQHLKLPRALASLIAVLLFLAVCVEIGSVSYNSAASFARELPKYSGKIRDTLGQFRQHAKVIQKTTEAVIPKDETKEGRPVQTVQVQQSSDWADIVTNNAGSVTEFIFMISFIPFLAFFMLSWQDHVRSATVMLFRMENRNTAYVTLGLISSMIRSFIVGNFLVGLFIGAISTAIFGILGLPYFYFIGFISGFLSLVPYLGVVLAVLPPIIAGLGHMESAGLLAIALSVFGLHLFALNVLYPKFLGSRLQLNPLAVTVALLFWGWLWGAMGLVLAVPMTAAAKIVFDHVEQLRGYGTWLGE